MAYPQRVFAGGDMYAVKIIPERNGERIECLSLSLIHIWHKIRVDDVHVFLCRIDRHGISLSLIHIFIMEVTYPVCIFAKMFQFAIFFGWKRFDEKLFHKFVDVYKRQRARQAGVSRIYMPNIDSTTIEPRLSVLALIHISASRKTGRLIRRLFTK